MLHWRSSPRAILEGELTEQQAELRFSRLHEEHFEAVRRYAWRRDARLADDVVAETFAVAWRRIEEVPHDARPWLIGVARNIRLNLLRSQRRQDNVAAELQRQGMPAASFDDPVSNELPPALAEALARLSPLDREVLLLHAWDELDRTAIAAAVGCSTANVSVRLHRAKRRFQAALAALTEGGDSLSPVVTTSKGAPDGC